MPIKTVYHHTSILRTNLIWMSGVIEVEGRSPGVIHPLLGRIQTEVSARRSCTDFPPLAWFTSDIRIPGCLLSTKIMFQPKGGGVLRDTTKLFGHDQRMMANGMALNRVALGFPIEGSTITRWKDHPGYSTAEGKDLNDTAREQGDDPNRWYVSEVPVDVLAATEIWTSRNLFRPKLEKHPAYLQEVRKMVEQCRQQPGVYIPPTWINNPTVHEMMRQSGQGLNLAEIMRQARMLHDAAA